MGRFIIAIDVGLKNLGLCIYDFVDSKVVHWACVNLVPNGKYIPSNNVDYVRSFVRRYDHYFSNSYKILIERQIRCNMRIVEAIIQTMFYEKCIIISARSVKMHYNLSTKNYRANKQKAVVWATQFAQANSQVFTQTALGAFYDKTKQDDLADSLLLVMYYLDTYSNYLDAGANVVLQAGFIL